jgi:Holliday junction resolvasome RuvABC DNA-binding subunit
MASRTNPSGVVDLLQTVNGIGPRIAVAALGPLEPQV